MKSLLNALQEGRLIELVDCNKEKALQYLAALIEAIPDLKAGTEVTEGVLAREKSFNTGLGDGWGCPHVRTPQDGELVCAVGWCPTGIDYGSMDQKPVHLIVMYYVPDVQKNAYLKEISSLARAIKSQPSLRELNTLQDLAETRHRLLDVITLAVESAAPDAKARMIRLEAKQAAVAELPSLPLDWSKQIYGSFGVDHSQCQAGDSCAGQGHRRPSGAGRRPRSAIGQVATRSTWPGIGFCRAR